MVTVETTAEGDAGTHPAGEEMSAMRLESPAFADGAVMPSRFAQAGFPGGENVSPPLVVSEVPDAAEQLVLVCIDLAPVAKRWVHWVVVGLPGQEIRLAEGASGTSMPPGAIELRSTNGSAGYQGPRPPAGTGPHEYRFTAFALDTRADLSGVADMPELVSEMSGLVIAQASYSGVVERL